MPAAALPETVGPSAAPAAAGRALVSAGVVYGLLVLIAWGPFGAATGMVNETTIVYRSQTTSVWDGFVLQEQMRERGGIFYQIAYLLGAALSFPGDFRMYQVVYATLWWARGFLAFLIVRRLLPRFDLFAYLVGAFTLLHASDLSLQSPGMLIIVGMIVWMLLSFYCLVVALQSAQTWRQLALIAAASLFSYLALWSYESELPLMLVFPVLAALATRRADRRGLLVAAAYWLVPLAFIARAVVHYSTIGAANSYQQSVLRKDWGLWPITSDLAFNIAGSLAFWRWGSQLQLSLNVWEVMLLATAGTAVVLAGAAALGYRRPADWLRGLPDRTVSLAALGAGGALFLLSFPAYIILSAARSMWRTQILSGLGAGVIFASLVEVAGRWITDRLRWSAALPLLVAIVAWLGVFSAARVGAFQYARWEVHRRAVAQVLRVAPSVRSGTVVVLVNVPSRRIGYDLTRPERVEPFGDAMWFDTALRLAYPGTQVAGLYYLADGSPAAGSGLVVKDGRWQPNGAGSFTPLVENVPVANTVVVEYQPDGPGRLLSAMPGYITSDEAVVATYAPERVIDLTQASRMTASYVHAAAP